MSQKKARGGGGDDPEDLSRSPLHAVLLADSFTLKFRPITLERPKVLLPLVNVPMIEYTLSWLETAGVEEVFVFCCAHAQQVKRHLDRAGWTGNPAAREMAVTAVESHDAISAGDALRVIYLKPPSSQTGHMKSIRAFRGGLGRRGLHAGGDSVYDRTRLRRARSYALALGRSRSLSLSFALSLSLSRRRRPKAIRVWSLVAGGDRSSLRHGQLGELEVIGDWRKLKLGGMCCTLHRHSSWGFHIADSVQRGRTLRRSVATAGRRLVDGYRGATLTRHGGT